MPRQPQSSPRPRRSRQHSLEGDLSDAQKRRLLDVAEHCPVDQTLAHGAEIHTSVSADSEIAAAPATSDYVRDIDDRINALQETLSPTE